MSTNIILNVHCITKVPSQTTNLISRTREGHFDLVVSAERCGGASRDNRGIVTKKARSTGCKSESKVAKNEGQRGQLGPSDPANLGQSER